MKKNFLMCGSIGWCLEIFWTGFHALLAGEPTMMGKTSLLMFPIYGCAALIGPVYKKLQQSLHFCVAACILPVSMWLNFPAEAF